MTELALADRLKLLRSKRAELRCERLESTELIFLILLMGDNPC